ncbi:hypothetical protein C7K43_06405 [Tetragenococcus koreensis]|nr:hypothetical protein C7K43_06405 [Tetragenococcus koreensis]
MYKISNRFAINFSENILFSNLNENSVITKLQLLVKKANSFKKIKKSVIIKLKKGRMTNGLGYE